MQEVNIDQIITELDNQMLNEGYMPVVYSNDIDEEVTRRNPCPKCKATEAAYYCYEHHIYLTRRGFAVCQKCGNIEEF